MNIEELRNYCLTIKGAEECTFLGNHDVLLYKVMGKVFAFFSLTPKDNEYFVVLKCDPEKTAELREKHEGITKGYYTGKTLKWNSIYIQRDVPNELIVALVKHSAEEVIKELPKKKQAEYLENCV